MSDQPMHPKVQLRFLRSWQHYRANDIATFPLGAAQTIVAARAAVAIAGVGPTPPPASAGMPQNVRNPSGRVEKG
jgi:hypothetical protein